MNYDEASASLSLGLRYVFLTFTSLYYPWCEPLLRQVACLVARLANEAPTPWLHGFTER